MGDSRPTHEVGTFSSRADDLHTRGIIPFIYLRDRLATLSANIHSVGHRPKVCGILLDEFPKGYGDAIDDEHRLPPTDIRSIGDDHTGVKRHAKSIRPGS